MLHIYEEAYTESVVVVKLEALWVAFESLK